MATLTALEQKGLDEISRKQLDVDWLLSAAEVFRKFSTELRDNGTACDVATIADRLHTRACELRKHDTIRQTKLIFSVTSIIFQQSTFGSKLPANLVGTIEERTSFKGKEFVVLVVAWRSGNALCRIKEVTLRRARLVLGWVTIN